MATAAQYARDGPGTAAKREALLAYLRVSQHTLKEASKTEYAANHYDELAAVGRSLERCVHNVVEGLTEDGADDRGVTPGTRKVAPDPDLQSTAHVFQKALNAPGTTDRVVEVPGLWPTLSARLGYFFDEWFGTRTGQFLAMIA
ncbi:hypothetical protein JL721_11122 [Aureococcus anophagefferens]|nr:hypothetical protein JL721_11122 [Aureococcus anophagefferens]KAH8097248.1 hypothetical protein JL720_133 [Aureococcus anophagefferens]